MVAQRQVAGKLEAGLPDPLTVDVSVGQRVLDLDGLAASALLQPDRHRGRRAAGHVDADVDAGVPCRMTVQGGRARRQGAARARPAPRRAASGGGVHAHACQDPHDGRVVDLGQASLPVPELGGDPEGVGEAREHADSSGAWAALAATGFRHGGARRERRPQAPGCVPDPRTAPRGAAAGRRSRPRSSSPTARPGSRARAPPGRPGRPRRGRGRSAAAAPGRRGGRADRAAARPGRARRAGRCGWSSCPTSTASAGSAAPATARRAAPRAAARPGRRTPTAPGHARRRPRGGPGRGDARAG